MKRFLFTVLFGVFAWCGIYSQTIQFYDKATHPDVYGYDEKYYKDSITESYYPRIFRLNPGCRPLIPRPSNSTNYRSELGEVVIAPGDTIRCVLLVLYSSQKNKVTKAYGFARLLVKRFKDGKIQPYGVWAEEKGLKKMKKRLKFKIDLYMEDYLGGKPKMVTANVNYDVISPRLTEVDYSVKDCLKQDKPSTYIEYGYME